MRLAYKHTANDFLRFGKRTAGMMLLFCFACDANCFAQSPPPIYHAGWIDFNKNGKKDVFEDPAQPVEARVADLLSQMTVDEKTCQMATLYGYGRVLKEKLPTAQWKNEIWKDGIANIDEHLNGVKDGQTFIPNEFTYPHSNHVSAINTVQRWFVENTRLGIPVDFTNEAIHGLNHDRATPLPAPIAIGSTWNKALVHQAGVIAGREGKGLGYTNLYAPILDVSRDPRWGRVVETYGENPFHIAALGIEMVKGIQSQGVASTLKHFAVYSVPKGGRDGNVRTDPHVAPREMHTMYLYPFRKVIKETHPMGVMSSYNDWDGEPVSGSYYFLTELLRQQFGFDGYVVSDSEAVEFLFSKHRVAGTYKDAVRQVVEAGLNVRTHFTPPQDFILPLRELVREGALSMMTLDNRVSDVLKVKFRLGLFDQPYRGDSTNVNALLNPDSTKGFVLEMARQSIVLLKNNAQLLPLDIAKTRKIFVTGPLADYTKHTISRYGPSNVSVVSVLEGLKKYAGNKAQITFSKGCEVKDASWPESELYAVPLSAKESAEIKAAVKEASKADIIIAVMGEDEMTVGESMTRTSLNLPGRQEQLLHALYATGKPIVLVLINGRPLTINWADKYIPAIMETWFSNPMGGQAVAEVLFGAYNPGGKLPITFPKSVGQVEYNFPFKQGSQATQAGSDKPLTAVEGPLYPFGHGLSYTQFSYSNLTVTPSAQQPQGDVVVTVDVTNTGMRKGDEVVQLYVKDDVSSVTTYDYDLRGFERIGLNAGEKKTVRFTLTPDDLSLLDKNRKWTVEPGTFQIMIGSSSQNIKLRKELVIK